MTVSPGGLFGIPGHRLLPRLFVQPKSSGISLESEWPEVIASSSINASTTNSNTSLRNPIYEWGPMPAQRHERAPAAVSDASLFMERIAASTDPYDASTSVAEFSQQQQQQLRIARPTNRVGQSKLDQWRRSKNATRGATNLNSHGAASRHWSDDGQFSPQHFPNSRSASALSNVSNDSYQRFASTSRARGDVEVPRPAWVNPIDSSATQTDDLPHTGRSPPSQAPQHSSHNTHNTSHFHPISTDDHPRNDGWNRFLVPPTPHRLLANDVMGDPVPKRALTHTQGTDAETPPPSTARADGAKPQPTIRIRAVAPHQHDNDSVESMGSSRVPTPTPRLEDDVPRERPSESIMFRAFQEQQQDMFKIIAAQQQQIAELTEMQRLGKAPHTSTHHHGEVQAMLRVEDQTPDLSARNLPSQQQNTFREEVGSVPTQHQAGEGTARSVQPAQQQIQEAPQSPRSPGSDRFTQTSTNAVSSHAVLLRRMIKSGPETDDDLMTSEDLEKKRQLKALQNMMELDKNTYHTLQKRDGEEAAALAQRRELSERLTRHLALQRKATTTGSSQVSSWSRSSSRSVREVGVGEENVFANPPQPTHYGFPPRDATHQHSAMIAAVSVLTSTDLLRMDDATTMTEKSSRTSTPLSARESPQLYQTARPPPVDRSTPTTPPAVSEADHYRRPAQPQHATTTQRPSDQNLTEEHNHRHHFQTANYQEPSRGTSTQTTRGTATHQPLPVRTHDPMEAFTVLRNRYLTARGRHPHYEDASSFVSDVPPQSDHHSWRRV
ncbi:Hypothetical protein, putative [Bodo saltans]|uniref:Uncharacterized protein n=1 Tax=Bodo saltans TaxID=75058 RepID=A0A0S4IUH7_BODSA|nr:Hypothetical protein, putative [Bodo saltans]|eukprot:CUE91175.1 Hypothetical protein, putative [Bodo saltans]